jgi:serine carboxypeptidase-like clade 2
MNTKGVIDFLWSHAVISDEVFANISKSCNFNLSDGKACSDAMAAYDSANADPFDIYGPVCIDAPDGTYYPSRYVRYCIYVDSTTYELYAPKHIILEYLLY